MTDRSQSMDATVWGPAFGGLVCYSASTNLVSLDLTSVAGHPSLKINGADQGPVGGQDTNPLGHYISIEADGADIYCVLSNNTAQVSAVTTVAVSTVSVTNQSSATYTAGGMWRVPNGAEQNWLMHQGGAASTSPPGANSAVRYLTFCTASGVATLRLFQSSQ